MDLQNASLSGGVIVGSVANLLLQPYGAIVAGSVAGIISTFGYQYLQVQIEGRKKEFRSTYYYTLLIL